MKSPRIVECSAERWRKCRCCETKRKKKNHPLRSPRKEAIFRRLAAIEFQSSKASETNGPIFETTTKLQPFTRFFLSFSSSPRRYTRHRNARLERDSHCPFVRGGQRTRRSGYVVPRLFQTRRRTWKEQPHRLIRKEWKGSIPSSFFLSSSFPFFGPSSPVEGANSCIWAWQIAARDPLMMRTNEWHEEERKIEKKERENGK